MLFIDQYDTVFAYDRRARRITVLSPAHRFVRVMPTRVGVMELVTLPDGGAIIPGRVLRGPGVGHHLHVFGVDGTLRQSFGGTGVVPSPGPPPARIQSAVARGRADTLWFTKQGRYDLEQWIPGRPAPLRILRRAADWFKPYEPRTPAFDDFGTPLPVVNGIRTDTQGHLWVSAVSVDLRYKPSRVRVGQNVRPVPIADLDRVFAGRLELIDPVSAKVITSTVTPAQMFFLRPMVEDGALMYSYAEDKDDLVVIDVWRVRVSFP
jgi:hypothetical protein